MDQWLKSIGLASRIAAFHDNGISPNQLNELTDDHLRELGLTIGERLRFRSALPNLPNKLTAAPLGQSGVTEAERRPLTVLFVDLVGSTGLGERLDPEDLLEVIQLYRDFCGAAITRYGGRIARFLGDGILAYFSYPVANENDPERATRAALDIVRGIGSLVTPADMQLEVRMGLATGRVIIGDLLAGGEADKQSIVGSCPNLAARLQALADANEILIAENTYARVRDRFRCEALGLVNLKGFEEPHHIWRVLGEISQQDKQELETVNPRVPFRGREAELRLLEILWRQALKGEGTVGLVIGEAGIGKSRLVEQFLRSIVADQAPIIRLAATAFDENSPLRPFVDFFRDFAGVSSADPADQALTKLEAKLSGPRHERKRAAAVIAGLLGVSVVDPEINRLLPAQLRERTITALVDQVLARAANEPLCLVVEDLHWLDPTSSELLRSLAEQVGGLGGHRLLILLTTRDVAGSDWSSTAQTTIRLGHLSAEHVAQMMHDMFGEASSALVQQVVDRTDGVPLFVEELARGLLARQSGSAISDALPGDPEADVPASLDESLMARLDRSGHAKEIAQAASVLGRTVRLDILQATSGADPAAMKTALNMLVDAGVMDRSHRSGTYVFHHALLRDAAYSSLLRDKRRDLHRRAARAIASLDPETASLHPEFLAQHLTLGGLAEEAAPCWLEAARRSLARSALTEATRMLQRGLKALEVLPPNETLVRLRIELSALLGPALIGLKGPNAPETQELYSTAYDLCRQVPEEPSHYPIYWGWWRLSPSSLERSAALMERALSRNDVELMLQAHHCTWASHLQLASFKLCEEHMRQGMAIYETGDFTHHARLYGNHDAKVCAHGSLCQVYWMQGKLVEAIQEEAESTLWAQQIDHVGSRLHAMGLTLLHRVYRRDYKEVYERSEQLLSFTGEYGLADHGSAGLVFKGWVQAMSGEPGPGLKLLEEGFARQREVATNEDFPVYLCLLSEVLGLLDRADEAVDRISRELPEFETSQLRIWIPELVRELGDATLRADPTATEQARKRYREAADLAHSQGVPMLGLRVAMSQAKLDLRTGDMRSGLVRLKSAFQQLEEVDHSWDVVQAQELMQRLNDGEPL